MLPVRLEQKIDRDGQGGCWLWTASLRDGYGQFRHAGRTRGAHLIVYELLVGPVPAGLELDHLCRVRRCVNPDHLESVDHRTNVLRSPIASAALKARQTHCLHGHPLSGDNLRITARGRRQCFACQRRNLIAWRLRQAAA